MKITLPVTEVDAGKFLHSINVGAHAQISLFEERVKQMGKELDANWQLASLDQKNVFIEDIDTHTYYQGKIENIGKGRVKITDLKELRIVESKKENTFKKNVSELITALSEDKVADADGIFNKIAKQRFRSSVIPESGMVTTRDGRARTVKVQREIIEEKDRVGLIKRIAEALKDGVKIERGRIVEAVFGDQTIKIPINEMTRRKVVAGTIKEAAKKAYLSEGFQMRVKHVATMVVEEKVKEAVQNFSEFFTENQEFSLLNITEMRELAGNSLAAQCCFNKALGNDVGTLMYRANCRANKDTIMTEWRKTARMTEYAPFVENVRRLEESKDFESDYNEFLAAIFTESSRDLNLEAAEHLLTLRKIRDLLTASKEQSEDLQKIDNYIRELEIKRENVDDAAIMEVRNFLAGLSEEIIDAAVALDAYSNPNIGTMQSFDEMPAASASEPKMFGASAGGEPADLGGIGEALPLEGEPGMGGEAGGDVAGMEGPGGELEGLGGGGAPEGEGAPEEEGSLEELLAADVQRTGKPLSEAQSEWLKNKIAEKGKKTGSSDKDDDKPAMSSDSSESEETECEDGAACEEKDILKIRAAVSELNVKGLHAELVEWKKNASKFIKEDGLPRATVQLKAYIDHARALNESKLASVFEQILVANTPIKVDSPVVEDISDDPYKYVVEGVKESEDGLGAGEPKKNISFPSGGDKTVTDMDGKHPNEVTHQPESTLKKGGQKIGSKTVGKVCCGECNSTYEIVDCLKEDTAICPRCGADVYENVMAVLDEAKTDHKMDSPEGKGLQKQSVGQVKISASGEKPTNDSPEGKGVAKSTPKKVDGTKGEKGGSKKEGMECQDGKPISGGVKGEVEEGSRRPPTSRKTIVHPFNKSAGFTTEEVDDVAARIAEAMGDEEELPLEDEGGEPGDVGGDDVAPPSDIAGGPAGGPEMGDADLVSDIGGASPEGGLGDEAGLPPVGGAEELPPSAPGMDVDQGTFEVDIPATSDTGDPVTQIKINLPGGEVEGIETVGEMPPPGGAELPPPGGEVPEEIPPIGGEEGPPTEIPPAGGGEGIETLPSDEEEDEIVPEEKEVKPAVQKKFPASKNPIGKAGEGSVKCPPDNKKTEKAARDQGNPKPTLSTYTGESGKVPKAKK